MNPENKESMNENEALEFCKILELIENVKILLNLAACKEKYKGIDFGSASTINDRVCLLLSLNLIEHHYMGEGKKGEWYTLSEKGEKVVECLETLINVL
jgi:hypothetical protein